MIEICTNHTGKMEGIQSISTSVLLNANCQHNRKVIGAVCAHCYAGNLANMYSGLEARLARNTETLTKPIEDKDIPNIDHLEIFRFEAFGDLNNEIQLDNYVKIVQANPHTHFALYTKQYGLVQHYFAAEDHVIPSNLQIIFSSLMLNHPMDVDKLGITCYYDGQLKCFTVYTKEYLEKHPEIKINCGARSCNTCRLCYNPAGVKYVNEILKSDRDAATFMIKMRDPHKKEEMIEQVSDIINKYL